MTLRLACILATLVQYLLIQSASCKAASKDGTLDSHQPGLSPRHPRPVPDLDDRGRSEPTCDYVRASWTPDPRLTDPTHSFFLVTLNLPEAAGWQDACDDGMKEWIKQTCLRASGVIDVDFAPSKPSERAGECSLLVDLTVSYYTYPRPKFGTETDCVLSALECMRPDATQPAACVGM